MLSMTTWGYMPLLATSRGILLRMSPNIGLPILKIVLGRVATGANKNKNIFNILLSRKFLGDWTGDYPERLGQHYSSTFIIIVYL